MSIYKGTKILKRSRSFGSETKQSGPDRPEAKEISQTLRVCLVWGKERWRK
jgi:hypothetical protein